MPCQTRVIPARWVLLALLIALAVTAGVALMVGSLWLSPDKLLEHLGRALSPRTEHDAVDRILLTARLPRVALAMAVGAAMGLSGLAAQTLFRNPLASPYVIGVSNGAAVGAVLGMLLVGGAIGYATVPAVSIAGGLIVAGAVYALGRRGRHLGQGLLLAGIAISAFCSALTAGALYLAGERLQTLVFWLMGGLWQARWGDVLLMGPVTLAGWIVLTILAPAMNVSLVGDRSAADLGVSIRRLQHWLLVTMAIMTAVAVSLSGVIGFVGLIVPHLLRTIIGADHRGLVPASALGGALLLLVADTFARTLAAPAEVPVGILTALLGAPVFLWQLGRQRPGAVVAL